MAYLWPASRIPWSDESGDPYASAKLYFFEAETTTPLTVFTEPSLSTVHDHPILANGRGSFPAIYIPELTVYRQRGTNASGSVVLFDDDLISVPILTPPEGGGGGVVDEEFLFQTGDLKIRYETSASHTGWVRCNGRTIGSASSGATERANADCQDLFSFLWDNDANLVVSGGRGANAASDWAANKRIETPDLRGRTPVGRNSMGNTASGRLTSVSLGGALSDQLGASAGVDSVTLTIAQMPTHNHSGTANPAGGHRHVYARHGVTTDPIASSGDNNRTYAVNSSVQEDTLLAGDHGHVLTIADRGSSEAHSNLQPSFFVTYYIKL